MSVSRRQFLKAMGGAGLLYAVRFAPGSEPQDKTYDVFPMDIDDDECVAAILDIDYSEWIVLGPDGKVSIFTGRTELGQGLKTVLAAVVTQGLEIPQGKLTIVQGDTELCPDDGPTTGSSATKYVGWGYWIACEKIRADLISRASRSLGIPVSELHYRNGGVGRKGTRNVLKGAFELGSGQVVKLSVDPRASSSNDKTYVDLGIPNVNAKKIVTGKLKYVGDLYIPGVLYAGWLSQPYHPKQTVLKSTDLSAARAIPGVKMVEVIGGRVAVVAERYNDVLKSLDAVNAEWSVPQRSEILQLEEESRSRAELFEVKEQEGNVDAGLAVSDLVVSETYTTQYTTQAPMETDTAIARMEDGGKRATVWASSQHPHRAREIVSKFLGIPESSIQVIGMPLGGGFGGKTSNPVTMEAAGLARFVEAPVKLIYSRKDQFQLRGRFKAACVIDLTTGVSANGKMMARKIDIIHDMGFGTTNTYTIPHTLTNVYHADWPFKRAVSRGTSFVQTCFAVESHVDMVAAALGIDPLEFRRNNVRFQAFVSLLDVCAEMIGYYNSQQGPNSGVGMAIVNHGGSQLGAVAAEVKVNPSTGKVTVKKICGAFDIGTVINRNTATVGIRGAITWGIGYALYEEIILNGHRTETEDLMAYHIPRFSDIPPVEIAFLDNYQPGSPRGCGEMPVIPTIGAIANAVYRAIGVRFYSTPITPEKVKKALQGA
ncbi:MAG: molybdopterin-dependent oxidoreductase [Candidatus Aminicenantes bacterium]|nr:molybdopterin-dependent oxidoreductase [Candidatus Aminicenantes bacterium]